MQKISHTYSAELILIVLVLFGGLSLTNCSRPIDQQKQLKKPERIVSLAPNITEILFSLGAGDRIVGVTNFCTYPPEALRIAKVGGFSDPNPEIILSLKPDLILATPNVGNRDSVLLLKENSEAEVLILKMESLQDLYDSVSQIGKAICKEENASSLVAKIKSDISAARANAFPPEGKKVLLSLSVDPVIAASPNSYPGMLAMLAGAELVPFQEDAEHGANPYQPISMEEIVRSNPDIIIQTRMDANDRVLSEAMVNFWKKWSSISAVKNNRVFIIPSDTILRPSPRAPEGMQQLIKLIQGQHE